MKAPAIKFLISMFQGRHGLSFLKAGPAALLQYRLLKPNSKLKAIDENPAAALAENL
jgi:hypothetical protein